MNFNKVILAGYLTRDVDLRSTQGGMAVAKFGMAVNRKWSQNGEQKESACFVDLTAFGRQAELFAEHVGKGSQLLVEGRLDFSSWEAKDGSKRSKLEVIVEQFQFVGSRPRPEDKPSTDRPAPTGDDEYADIPF